MNEEDNTKEMSFEQRVFARFDAQDELLRELVQRVTNLEQWAEQRTIEIKPKWKKALAEIAKTRLDMAKGKKKKGKKG